MENKKKWEASDYILILGITILSFALRYVVKGVVTKDWTIFWGLWFDELKAGGFNSLAGDWYDYTPPFVFLMYIISILPVNCMTGYKVLVSIFDLAAAVCASKIIWELTKNQVKTVITYAVFMAAPVFIVNSVLWAQCDMVPMLWVLLCIYFFIKKKPNIAMLFFGIAVAFKLQPVWLVPVLIILWVNHKVQIKHFLWIPACYMIGILPAWIAGRPLKELLGVYLMQSGVDYSLSLKYVNVYYLIGTDTFHDEYYKAGLWLSMGIFMCVLYYIGRKHIKITPKFIIILSAFIGILAPFFLPHMHERYAFFGEVFLILYVIMNPKRFYLPVLQILNSFMGYSVFLADDWNLPLEAAALVELVVLFGVGMEVYNYISNPENQISEKEVETC